MMKAELMNVPEEYDDEEECQRTDPFLLPAEYAKCDATLTGASNQVTGETLMMRVRPFPRQQRRSVLKILGRQGGSSHGIVNKNCRVTWRRPVVTSHEYIKPSKCVVSQA